MFIYEYIGGVADVAKGKYEYWLTDEGLTLLKGWAREGLTDEQIAHNMGIAAKTLYRWKEQYCQICQSLKKGKDIIDYEVENALLKRALGYKIKEQKVAKDGSIIEIEKDLPPDVTAMIFWLKNRKPNNWRDKIEKIGTDADSKIYIVGEDDICE